MLTESQHRAVHPVTGPLQSNPAIHTGGSPHCPYTNLGTKLDVSLLHSRFFTESCLSIKFLYCMIILSFFDKFSNYITFYKFQSKQVHEIFSGKRGMGGRGGLCFFVCLFVRLVVFFKQLMQYILAQYFKAIRNVCSITTEHTTTEAVGSSIS